MWVDPDSSNTQGVLLSDRIGFYVDKVRLIEPFTDANLGPASYDLTLGAECWYAEHLKDTGQAKRILSPGERLILRPNSITFVSTREILNLPFYLVARFNLKLRFLHEGLLLGAGPQIDPGFRGRLSCPIHNISSEKISLSSGETFAVIEFHKTSPFAQQERLTTDTAIEEVRWRGEARELKGVGGYPCITFPTRSLDREPVKRYVPAGRLVTSSVEQIETQQNELKEQIDKELTDFRTQMRSVNFMTFIAVATVALSLGTYFFAAVNWNKSVNDSAVRAEERVKVLETENNDLEKRLIDLEQKMDQILAASKEDVKRRPPIQNIP
jgi:deoxycytidine triphosphate deaminase